MPKRSSPDQDEYGEVLNSDRTYAWIAETVERSGSAIIGWTDGLGSHMDILFCLAPIQKGGLQRGMSALTDLFVAVSHFGMHGFEIKDDFLHPGYVAEKLGTGDNSTTAKLTDLITGVRDRL